MSDRAVIVVVGAFVVGAWSPPGALIRNAGLVLSTVGLVALGLTAWVPAGQGSRRCLVTTVAVLVAGAAGAGLGARAWHHNGPLVAGNFEGTVTLVSDPRLAGTAVQAEVRAGGAHVEAWFRGADAGTARHLLSGERLEVTGRLQPRRADERWLALRHVTGRLEVSSVGAVRDGTAPFVVANRLHRALARGSDGLGEDERSLVAGLVLGDDRTQRPLVADDFRAAGLTHLLAVSGQNVSYLVVAAGPVLSRLAWPGRWALTVALLVGLAVLTRFEPSVLRATAMALVAVSAAARGRPLGGGRALTLAVGGLVAVDPLLVHRLGFQLSVAASAAILALAPHLVARCPGPRGLAEVAGTTAAAQLGVAPLLIPVTGGIPVVTLVANVVVAPAVGPLSVWSMTAGIVASVLPARFGGLLHLPTRLLAGWILTTARLSARAGLGEWRAAHLMVVAVAAGVGLGCRRIRRCDRSAVLVARLVAVMALAAPVVGPHPVSLPGDPLAPGARWWPGDGGVLVLGPGAQARSVLEETRRHRTGSLGLLVVTSTAPAVREAAVGLVERHRPRRVWAPVPGLVPGAEVPAPGRWAAGGWWVDVSPVEGTMLGVQVGPSRRRWGRVLASSRAAPPPAPGPRPPPRRHHPSGGGGHPEPHPGLVL